MPDRFLRRTARGRRVPCMTQIPQSATILPSPLKMHSQFYGPLIGAVSVRRLFPDADPPMEAYALEFAKPIINHAAIKPMSKTVARRERSIRPFSYAKH